MADPEASRSVALRIEVDQQTFQPIAASAVRVDRGGGLAYSALLVGNDNSIMPSPGPGFPPTRDATKSARRDRCGWFEPEVTLPCLAGGTSPISRFVPSEDPDRPLCDNARRCEQAVDEATARAV